MTTYGAKPIVAISRCVDWIHVLYLEPYQQGAKIIHRCDHEEGAHDFIEQHGAEFSADGAELVPIEAMSAELWDRRNARLYDRRD